MRVKFAKRDMVLVGLGPFIALCAHANAAPSIDKEMTRASSTVEKC